MEGLKEDKEERERRKRKIEPDTWSKEER